MNEIRAIIVDDHAVVAEGIARLLEETGSVAVVGRAGCLREATLLVERLKPDLVLLDLRLPDSEGADTVRAVRAVAGRAKIIVLTAMDWGPGSRACEVLADLFLGKQSASTVILDAIRRLFPDLPGEPQDDLTARESEVAHLAAEGLTNGEIARTLSISENTVKTHVARILSKLQLANRTDLARRWRD